jgi:hypothetical protein
MKGLLPLIAGASCLKTHGPATMDDDDFMAQSHEYVDMAGMLPTLGSFMMLDKKSPAEKHHSLADEEMV